MARVLVFVFSLLTSTLRPRVSLQLEIAALRHQLATYRSKGQKPRIAQPDRLLWSVLVKWWSQWRGALFFAQPRTVTLWQQKRFWDYWRAQSQGGRPGRPKIARGLRNLIRRMWQANPTWGSPRIVAELHKLGIEVAKSTVEKYKPRGDRLPSATWRTHRSLDHDAPDGRPVRRSEPAQVVEFPVVHGLHHYYLPKAA
jgi:hypothetical protein